MKIYVASSWRNAFQPSVVATLREHGFDVYDFKNPAPGDHGFSWKQTGVVEADGHVSVETMRAMLRSDVAKRGFRFDRDACAAADACVLVLPCGLSAHLEAGWISGSDRPVIVYAPNGGLHEPELMYKFFDGAGADGETPIYATLAEVVTRLRSIRAEEV